MYKGTIAPYRIPRTMIITLLLVIPILSLEQLGVEQQTTQREPTIMALDRLFTQVRVEGSTISIATGIRLTFLKEDERMIDTREAEI
jgi:hypothetical protein